MFLFKSDKEKFENELSKALSEKNKGNLENAAKHFLNAYEIASKTKDPEISKRSNEVLFYALFYDALVKKTAESFSRALEQCRKLDPDQQLDIGLATKPVASELCKDLEIASMIASLPAFSIDAARDMDESIASRYEEVGNKLLAEGSRRLIIEDYLKINDPLSTIGLRFLGYSRIIRALRAEADDPAKAVELYSEAIAFLQQSPAEIKKFVDTRMSKLSKTTRCWVCRREIQGEEINYIYLPASLSKYIIEKYGNESPYLISEGRIAVCRVCYTMIYNLSDALAKNYYERAIKELREVEARLSTRISMLEARLMSQGLRVGRRYYMRE